VGDGGGWFAFGEVLIAFEVVSHAFACFWVDFPQLHMLRHNPINLIDRINITNFQSCYHLPSIIIIIIIIIIITIASPLSLNTPHRMSFPLLFALFVMEYSRMNSHIIGGCGCEGNECLDE